MSREIIKTEYAPAAIGPYSQAVKAGNMLFISGQIPINYVTQNVVTDGIEAETHQVMKNILAILEAAKSTIDKLVKTTIFIKDMNDFAKINAVYSSYFTIDFPARETVEVSRLPKDVNVEISAIAYLD